MPLIDYHNIFPLEIMHYLFGGMKEKEQKSIENDQFPQKLAVVLRKQFCMICGSSPSTKIAFGQGVKPAFTCNSCELKAVGGVVQKMTEKNLIDNQKFAQILTTSLIGYQKRQVLSIPHFK